MFFWLSWEKTLWQFRKFILFYFFLSSTLNSNLKSYMVFGCKIEDNLHFIFSNSRFSSFGVVNTRCPFPGGIYGLESDIFFF